MDKKKLWIGLGVVVVLALLYLIFHHRHDFASATCTLPATCECGETQGSALGHNWQEATCTEPETCSRCGQTGGEALGHDFLEATCTEPAICARCGVEEGEALGHSFSEGSCTEDRVCANCGEVIKATGHDFAKATCELPETCKVCGETKGNALGHNFVSGTCATCGISLGTLESLKKINNLTAKCETSMDACLVNVDESENPYDVVYDYGEFYNQLVENADWSLVFDANYYKKTFPMLAMQYHNDDALLLKHFQTVGVHEGRQASEKFNVIAYYYNCADSVYQAFKSEKKNYAPYYFYYMFHYDTEKDVNTVSADNGKEIRKQGTMVLTAVQKQELADTNKYRSDAGEEDYIADSELNAIANYRAYVNQVEGWVAHDWCREDKNHTKIQEWIQANGSASYAENEVEGTRVYDGKVCATKYYNSPEHCETLLSKKYKYVGMSNTYQGKTKNARGYVRYNLDVYFTAVKNTQHP